MPLNPYQTIIHCANTSSTTEKVKILQENDSRILRESLKYGLDPYKVYGIKKYQFVQPVNHEEVGYESIFGFLDLLIARVYTGDSAKEKIAVLSARLTVEQQTVLNWILQKDFRAGIAEGLVNKAFPKLIPEFEVQLAQPEKRINKVRFPCLVQPKLDGVRTIALVDTIEKNIVYYSRNGKVFTNFKCFDKELFAMCGSESKMFDGEVVGPPGEDFIGIMQQCRRKHDVDPKGLNFHVFDWMPFNNFGKQSFNWTQQERTDYLLEGIGPQDSHRVKLVKGVICNDMPSVERAYDGYVNEGYEGIIIKDLQGEYEFKRTDAWVKMKPDTTEDLKVVDVQEGTNQFEGLLGALVVERNGVRINVGSGFKKHERIPMSAAIEEYLGTTIEVKYDTVTPDGSLRFPRFIKVREDK